MTLRTWTLMLSGAVALTAGTACGGADKDTDTELTDEADDDDDDDDDDDTDEPSETDTDDGGSDTEMLFLIGYFGVEGTVTLGTTVEKGDTGDTEEVITADFDGHYTARFNDYFTGEDMCTSMATAVGANTSYECDECEWQFEVSATGTWETQEEVRGICEYFTPNGEEVEFHEDPLIIGMYSGYSGYTTYTDIIMVYYRTYGWYLPGFMYYYGTSDWDEDKGALTWEMLSFYGYYYY